MMVILILMKWEEWMSKILNEKSLKPEVLKDLIHPIISIDEYTPKINDSNIVVNFKVLDNFDAAYDLSSFIERSPEEVVDTEAVETPDVDGFYNVFVEMERNAEFPESLVRLIKDIENLSPNVQWKLQLYRVNDPVDLDVKKLSKNIKLNAEDELREFFDYAAVELNVLEEGFELKSVYGSVLKYSNDSGFISEDTAKFKLKQDTRLDETKLSSVLGSEYDVLKSGSELIVGRNGKYIILR